MAWMGRVKIGSRRSRAVDPSATVPQQVLHLVANSAGGTYYRLVARHFSRDAYSIRFASLTPPGPLHEQIAAAGVPTLALGCDDRRDYPRAVLSLAALLRRSRVTILQTHLFDATLVGVAAACLARTPLVVVTAHHSNDLELHHRLRDRKLSFYADTVALRHLADRVIAPSNFTRETLIREQGMAPERVEAVAYGFELGALVPDSANRSLIRQELRIEDGEIVLGAVGRLHWVKDYPSMIRAFASASREIPNLRLLIVGEGDERSALEELVRSLGLGSRVTFCGFRTDVPALLSAMDVFVHSSLTESFNQALIEAMALGKPVITTRVGIASDLGGGEGHGRVVPPGDTEAFTSAVLQLIRDRHTWSDISQTNASFARQFTGERMMAGYESAYSRWLGQSL